MGCRFVREIFANPQDAAQVLNLYHIVRILSIGTPSRGRVRQGDILRVMAAPKMPQNSIQLQERDATLLRGLFESRVMTSDHAAALYFEGRDEATKKRLQKLKAAGFLSERPRRSFEPSVLFLTRKGLVLLQEQGALAQFPAFNLPVLENRARVSDLTIRHELEVMDVKAAFHSAVRNVPALTVAEFSTWPLLNEFRAYHPAQNGLEVPVKPDGFIRLHETEADGSKFEHALFLEVDRSTETQDKLIIKAGCYFDYYKSGNFAVRSGGTRDDYKQFPFRVLIVFKTAERRNNTAERLLQHTPPILTQAWLTTFAEVTADPFGAIWVRPTDYRDMTKGTAFDAERPGQTFTYRRNAAREAFIESKILKRRLLES